MEIYPTIKFIDPSIVVVSNIKKLLINNNLVKKTGYGRMRILTSDKKYEFQRILFHLGIREKIEEVFWSL